MKKFYKKAAQAQEVQMLKKLIRRFAYGPIAQPVYIASRAQWLMPLTYAFLPSNAYFAQAYDVHVAYTYYLDPNPVKRATPNFDELIALIEAHPFCVRITDFAQFNPAQIDVLKAATAHAVRQFSERIAHV